MTNLSKNRLQIQFLKQFDVSFSREMIDFGYFEEQFAVLILFK